MIELGKFNVHKSKGRAPTVSHVTPPIAKNEWDFYRRSQEEAEKSSVMKVKYVTITASCWIKKLQKKKAFTVVVQPSTPA